MKVVLLSDTHNNHDKLDLPACDVLIHSGDWSRHGTPEETTAFIDWFGRQQARVRVLTPGNHDLFAEREPQVMAAMARERGVLWLLDEGADVLGLRVWASPFTPVHGSWAFQEERGAQLGARWQRIPQNLDVLITHGPPHGVCDRIARDGSHVGCESLLEVVRARPPRFHVFGHVHEGRGEGKLEGIPTRFLNVSSFMSLRVRNPTSEDMHPPVVLDLDPTA